MICILSSLKPRYYDENESLFDYNTNAYNEALFVMSGKFNVAFKRMVDRTGQSESDNWYRLPYHNYFHDASKVNCRVSVVGDYCMFFKKQSDILYKASETVMGYALQRQDWIRI